MVMVSSSSSTFPTTATAVAVSDSASSMAPNIVEKKGNSMSSLFSSSGQIIKEVVVTSTKSPLRLPRRNTSINLGLKVGRDKYDFDAPQFEDFTKPEYQHLLPLFDDAINGTSEGWNKITCHDDWLIEEFDEVERVLEGAEGEVEEWFKFVHYEHENSSPASPAGPLISPLTTAISPTTNKLSSSHSTIKLSSFNLHHDQDGSGQRSYISSKSNSHQRENIQQLGTWRSKARRVFTGKTSIINNISGSEGRNSGSGSSVSGATVKFGSLDISDLRNGFRKGNVNIESGSGSGSDFISHTPIGRINRKDYLNWNISPLGPRIWGSLTSGGGGPRRSSSIEGRGGILTTATTSNSENTPTQHRVHLANRFNSSNNDISSGIEWSSIPETPPVLHVDLSDFDQDKDRDHSPTLLPHKKVDSPNNASYYMPPATISKVTGKKISSFMKKAERVERQPPPSLAPVIPPPPQPTQPTINRSLQYHRNNEEIRKATSPLVKRVKVDVNFCPAIRSKNASPPPAPAAGVNHRSNALKLQDEVRQLLNAHNHRARHRHQNITRRR